ncbi:MAG: nitroreductase family protein [Propionibacteriaceae bacterium]|jgi:nitroreductase|nr:nitroreductase family protein [Propionibacteriaceae bacterium]
MSDTLSDIRARYACRAFSDQPVPAATLHTIAEAGLHAPSAVNRQPWRVIAVTNRDAIAALETAGLAALKATDATMYERIQGRGGKLLYNAQAIIVVAEEPLDGPFPAALDVGIVASHVALAATSLGVNCVIAALPGFAFSGPDGPALRDLFHFPEGYRFGISILLGYAAGAPGTPHEIDLAKLIEIA